ncbi:MAG: NAD(P)/FAD-dependent oxidoreductase [Magnetococcales bacterium]|nr:NAD(P)/FAD-dependent oxidoreductase [Magnetococcales bacterium]
MGRQSGWLQRLMTFFEEGAIWKWRFLFQGGKLSRFPRLDPYRRLAFDPIDKGSRILVVGDGVAAFTLLQALHRYGFRHLTLLAPFDTLGGTCLHHGCMVSAWLSTRENLDAATLDAGLTQLRQKLVQGMTHTLENLGVHFEPGSLQEIDNQTAITRAGGRIAFDRLVLATGSRRRSHPILGETLSLPQFWSLREGHIVIVNEGSPEIYTLAHLAQRLGLRVTLLLTGNRPQPRPPSLLDLQSRLQEQGVVMHHSVRILERHNTTLSVTVDGRSLQISFEHLFHLGAPIPNLPRVDGHFLTLGDLDLERGSFRHHENLYAVGDAAGFFTAAEAQWHAEALARTFSQGTPMRWAPLERLPMLFHGDPPLAMVGEPLSLFRSKGWRRIDFSSLGWSAIHGIHGQLWYLPCADGRSLSAIHIAHPQADLLIGQAAALLDYALDDPRWQLSAPHPSAGEIFHLLISDWRTFKKPSPVVAKPSRLPRTPVSRILHLSSGLIHFSLEERQAAPLQPDPERYLKLLLALKNRLGLTSQETLPLIPDGKGGYVADGVGPFRDVWESSTGILKFYWQEEQDPLLVIDDKPAAPLPSPTTDGEQGGKRQTHPLHG